ncbi:unnamed protein product [Kluyveromyces dobzhanskii CBS 2104]|uniref:Adenylate cyclase n=1 Tax=Kluyveromyces dobzhanskii CBS 2104 TaxID=1427455 RepID=A0A0A8L7Q9_9SACH|nr:unnamed protein product [Kluyveromyces dobzhanskii CBS 2104]
MSSEPREIKKDGNSSGPRHSAGSASSGNSHSSKNSRKDTQLTSDTDSDWQDLSVPTFKEDYSIDSIVNNTPQAKKGFHSAIGRDAGSYAHNPQPPLERPVKPSFERSRTANLTATTSRGPLPALSRTSSAISISTSASHNQNRGPKPSRASNFFKKLTSRKSSLVNSGGSGEFDNQSSQDGRFNVSEGEQQSSNQQTHQQQVPSSALRRKMSTFIHGPSTMSGVTPLSSASNTHTKAPGSKVNFLLHSNTESRRGSTSSAITSLSSVSNQNQNQQHGPTSGGKSIDAGLARTDSRISLDGAAKRAANEKFGVELDLNTLSDMTDVVDNSNAAPADTITKVASPSPTIARDSNDPLMLRKQWTAPESWDVDETVGLDVKKIREKNKISRANRHRAKNQKKYHKPQVKGSKTQTQLLAAKDSKEPVLPHVHHHDFEEDALSPRASPPVRDANDDLSLQLTESKSTGCDICYTISPNGDEDSDVTLETQSESIDDITSGRSQSRPGSPLSQSNKEKYTELDGETEYEEHLLEKYYSDLSDIDQTKKYAIRIFNVDDTFTTLSCHPSTTVAELIPQIKKKFNIQQGNFQLSLKVGKLSKILRPTASPILIQIKLLLLNGYKKSDPLHILGLEDVSFVFSFKFHPVTTSQLTIEQQQRLSKGDFIHVDLRNMNLTTPPIIFYQHTSEIESLDVSNNANIFLPIDFIESAVKLSSLRMVNVRASKFPANITQSYDLVSLDLERNFIKRVPESISKLSNLTILNLQCNHLDRLPSGFKNLKNLQLLDISSNVFTSYPEVINNCTNLLQVDLSYNKISLLPSSMNELSKLAKMNLSNNKIQAVPDLSGMANLRTLNLKNNRVATIKSNAPNLQNLFLASNRISVWEDSLPKLRSCDLTENPVTSFGYRGSVLSNLTSLSLNKAKLSSLPTDFLKSLQKLEKLELNDNNLTSLPSQIKYSKKLIHFSAANNKLDSIPTEIGNLSNLRSLDLHCNNISELPVSIEKLELTSINVSSNLLGYDALLEGYRGTPLSKSLLFLNAADNNLSNEMLPLFNHNVNLKILNLSYNDLSDISAMNLPSLTELYLSGNNLTNLPGEVFQRMKNLKVIMLNGNKLMSLPSELSQLSNLSVLDVGSNQLKYNISNYHYDWNWMNNLNLKYLNFSGNKRFEIKSMIGSDTKTDLSDLTILKQLKILGLMDVTMKTSRVPDDGVNFRLRTTGSMINGMKYGVADTLGKMSSVSTRDIKYERFRGKDDECLFCLYDSVNENASSGHKISQIIRDIYDKILARALEKYGDDSDENIRTALRFSFLQLNKEINGMLVSVENGVNNSELSSIDLLSGASATVVFFKDKSVYTANIGNIGAILAKNNGDYEVLTRLHVPTKRDEYERIRIAGGYVNSEKLDGVSEVSRAVGFFDLLPHIHASPDISDFKLTFSDQMLIIASHNLWNYIDYEIASDIARENGAEPMLAAEKLKDYAVTYGCTDKLTVVCICVEKGATETNRFNISKKDLLSRKSAFEDNSLRRLQPEIPPPTGNVAIVFTDIKNSTFIWELFPDAMRTAIKTHNDIMRRQLRIFGGYEVKTEGDAFMVAFPTPTSALVWCLSVQVKLLEAEWPGEITSITDGCLITDNSGNKIYQGLSVRMGIHWGCPVPEIDVVTKRMDYLGPVVNKAARVSGIADGGQVMLSNDFMVEFNKILSYHQQVTEDGISLAKAYGEDIFGEILEREIHMLSSIGWKFFELGEQALKGLETKELVTIAYPTSLQARHTLATQDQKNSVISDDFLFDIRSVSNRLETILSSVQGGVIGLEGAINGHYSNFDSATKQAVMKKSSEADLLAFLDHLITRIESSVVSINLRQQLQGGLVIYKSGDATKQKSIFQLLDEILSRNELCVQNSRNSNSEQQNDFSPAAEP